jgi:sugar/nucleoside kinase (ribokinase family)
LRCGFGHDSAVKSRVELLVLGHVTRDEIDAGNEAGAQGGEERRSVRWGGAAAYAALAAARLGVRTGLVTAAPLDSPLLDELRAETRLSLHVVPSTTFTTFALRYAGGQRSLWLLGRAPSLRFEDIPPAFTGAPTVYVAPVAGECSAGLVRACAARTTTFVGVGLQGWLREIDAGEAASVTSRGESRLVRPALDASILEVPGVAAAVASEVDHPDITAFASRLVDRGTAVAITRGARGASLFHGHARVDVPAAQADEREPTGAGDVFGVVFTLQLANGASLREAGAAAAEAAARVVEGPGLGTLSRQVSLATFSAGVASAREGTEESASVSRSGSSHESGKAR